MSQFRSPCLILGPAGWPINFILKKRLLRRYKRGNGRTDGLRRFRYAFYVSKLSNGVKNGRIIRKYRNAIQPFAGINNDAPVPAIPCRYAGFTGRSVMSTGIPWFDLLSIALWERNSEGLSNTIWRVIFIGEPDKILVGSNLCTGSKRDENQ